MLQAKPNAIPVGHDERGFREPGKNANKLADDQWHHTLTEQDMALYIEHGKTLSAKSITAGMGLEEVVWLAGRLGS